MKYYWIASTIEIKTAVLPCREINTKYYVKLLIENKLIICALGNLHYKISREKFEPQPVIEL